MDVNLTFDTGLVEYEVNGGAKIRFNPTDLEFAGGIFDAIRDLSEIHTRYLSSGDAKQPDIDDLDAVMGDPVKAEERVRETSVRLEQYKQIDMAMRGRIDDLFGAGTADSVFGSLRLYSYADGLPIWLNFLLAVYGTFPDAVSEQVGLSDERLAQVTAQYTAKYRDARAFRERRRKKRRT